MFIQVFVFNISTFVLSEYNRIKNNIPNYHAKTKTYLGF